MSEFPLAITALNDFMFCPVSIYFHGLYGDAEQLLYQGASQLNGKNAHRTIDSHKYSTSSDILQGADVYCEKYNLVGKIDVFHKRRGELVERKKKVHAVYDGFVWQLYAQYFALGEMGYTVRKLVLHSLDDNKNYPVALPEDSPIMLRRFEDLLCKINEFDVRTYIPTDSNKCAACIYRFYCDRSLVA